MKYRITYTGSPEITANLKRKGGYPFPCDGVLFDESTVHECDDLTPFLADKRHPEGGLHPWLKAEEIQEGYGETTDTEI